MTLLGDVMSLARPQFLVGFFIGICLSSAALQVVLLSLGMKGLGKQLSPSSSSPRAPEEQLLFKRSVVNRDSPSDYEVHNLGLKLAAAEGETHGGHGESHVIKYFREEQLPAAVHYDSLLPGGELRGAGKAAADGGGRAEKGLVYAGVLTDRSRLADQAAVVRMTWGSELPTVQFFYDLGDENSGRAKREHMREVVGLPDVSAGEVFTAKHTVETLRHVCSRHQDDYLWYVLVRDATYVHTSGLLRILDRLSPSEDLVIGQMESAHDGICSATPGMILSSRALSRICPRLDKCARNINVEKCLGMQCVSSKKIAPDFHVTALGGHVDVGQLVGGAESLPQLSDQSVFVGTLPYTRDFYRLHLHFTRVKIARTQEEIQRLGQELTRTRRSVRSKRDKSMLRVQETAIFGSDALLNKTTEPFYQFIDSSGNLYLETCKVRKQDVGKEGSSPYSQALELAKASVETTAKGLDYFSYKVTKPNVGIEYQFYFIQTLNHNPTIGHRKKPPKEKVYQVTVLHPYDKLEMESKEIQAVRTINFVVPTTGTTESLNKFLLNFERVCLSRGLDRCSLLIIIYKKAKDPHGNSGAGLSSKDVRRALIPLQERYTGMNSKVMEVQGESLTLARTVQMADSAYNRDDLLAFLQPDVSFTEDFLYRCQLNTLSMKRAYFPVVFQQYGHTPSPNVGPPPGEGDAARKGYWANSDFTTFCAYNEDIQLFDNLPSSPRDLHNMFKASEYMGVFRAPDPGLTREWKSHDCSRGNSLDRNNCVKELKYMNMQ